MAGEVGAGAVAVSHRGRWSARALLGHLYPHPVLWAALGGVLALNAIWLSLSPRLSLAPASLGKMLLVLALLAPALIYRAIRGPTRDRLLELLFRLLLLALFAGAMTQQVNVFSHLMMSLGLPLVDRQLAGWDQALGFDWNGYARLAAAWGWSRAVLAAAYSLSIGPALLAILVALVWSGRHGRVNEVAFLALASGLVSVGIAGLLPADSAGVTQATPATQALLGPQSMAWFDQFTALRGGGPVSLDLASMEGIATFPSFHACLALIILWCSRGHWAGGLAGGACGLAILAATPVYGGHYLVDLMAAGLVMVVLVLLWPRLAAGLGPAGAGP